MASDSFKTQMRAEHNSPRLRLTLDGTDYDDEVISVSQIVRNSTLGVGTVTVTVDNSTGTFNTRITDNTWDQQISYVKLFFSGGAGTLNLFAGIPHRVQYIGKNAVIYLRDRMAKMLARPVGNWEVPEDYYSSAYNPADLVWGILTDADYGNLDDTASSANTDIDYAAWTGWKTDCTNSSYSVKGRFTGQTIRDILLKACELTDTYIWVNADGKFDFSMNGGVSPPAGSETYTDDTIVPTHKSGIPFLDTDIDYIINSQRTYFDYDPVDDEWDADADVEEDGDSIANYGKTVYTELDKSLWHDDESSVNSYQAAFESRHKDPRRYVQFETFMASWLEDIGNEVTVVNSLLSINATMTIIEMVLLPNEGKTRMKLWWEWS